jgi:adenine phosphoribosyltransferase
MPDHETYSIEIAGLQRDLRLFEIKPGLRIAILNILGDTELVQAAAKALTKALKPVDFDILVTAEAKSIPLAYALSVETKKPYIVLRKAYKPYMGAALIAETLSITTGEPQTLIMDEKDQELVRDKKAVLVDDVISTGST